MNANSIVTIITTTAMRETRAFYTELLGFEISFDHEHYLGLRGGSKGSPELAFMRPDADAPDTFPGKGVTLAISIADADAECTRLQQKGVSILQPPTDQPWGARSFVVADPNGVTIHISHPIPAAVEFAACVR